MPEKKLKSCPFCGSEKVGLSRELFRPPPELCEIEGHPGQYTSIPRSVISDGWLIECETCGARGPHEYTNPVQSMDKARMSWNQRNHSDGINIFQKK
jgi:hypothetical protein